jgi:archaellin
MTRLSHLILRTPQNIGLGTVADVSTFSLTYVKTGPDYIPNYLTVGDIVKIQFNSTYNISQSQTVKMKIIPKRGVIVPVDFVTPDVMSTQRISLYP